MKSWGGENDVTAECKPPLQLTRICEFPCDVRSAFTAARTKFSVLAGSSTTGKDCPSDLETPPPGCGKGFPRLDVNQISWNTCSYTFLWAIGLPSVATLTLEQSREWLPVGVPCWESDWNRKRERWYNLPSWGKHRWRPMPFSKPRVGRLLHLLRCEVGSWKGVTQYWPPWFIIGQLKIGLIERHRLAGTDQGSGPFL